MPGLHKVQSGDPLVIPAATFNTFVDTAQEFLRRGRSIGRTSAAIGDTGRTTRKRSRRCGTGSGRSSSEAGTNNRSVGRALRENRRSAP